jgi:hypothetical protein
MEAKKPEKRTPFVDVRLTETSCVGVRRLRIVGKGMATPPMTVVETARRESGRW